MHNDEIFGLTPLGEQQLRSSATTLSASELDLLVRIDPTLSVARLRAAVPAEMAPHFQQTMDRLRNKGLIAPIQLDTFAMQLEQELANFSQHKSDPEAEAGIRSLKRSGYYVSVARKNGAVAPPAAGKALTAVVVEDDPNLSKFVSSYLTFAGFTVRTAANRAQVLAVFREPPIADVVLLDVMLPDVNGFDVLGSLRRHPAFRTVPVVMLTGKSTREDVLRGLAGGADGYVTKPFEPDALMAAVRTVLGLPQPSTGLGR
jgi:CheY-like chemotaxis protein